MHTHKHTDTHNAHIGAYTHTQTHTNKPSHIYHIHTYMNTHTLPTSIPHTPHTHTHKWLLAQLPMQRTPISKGRPHEEIAKTLSCLHIITARTFQWLFGRLQTGEGCSLILHVTPLIVCCNISHPYIPAKAINANWREWRFKSNAISCTLKKKLPPGRREVSNRIQPMFSFPEALKFVYMFVLPGAVSHLAFWKKRYLQHSWWQNRSNFEIFCLTDGCV